LFFNLFIFVLFAKKETEIQSILDLWKKIYFLRFL